MRPKALRPCEITGMGNGFFHKWTKVSQIVGPSMGGHSGGVVTGTLAIVEFLDGSVATVEPQRIRFTDVNDMDTRIDKEQVARALEYAKGIKS